MSDLLNSAEMTARENLARAQRELKAIEAKKAAESKLRERFGEVNYGVRADGETGYHSPEISGDTPGAIRHYFVTPNRHSAGSLLAWVWAVPVKMNGEKFLVTNCRPTGISEKELVAVLNGK